jgi:hypothetical protein
MALATALLAALPYFRPPDFLFVAMIVSPYISYLFPEWNASISEKPQLSFNSGSSTTRPCQFESSRAIPSITLWDELSKQEVAVRSNELALPNLQIGRKWLP